MSLLPVTDAQARLLALASPLPVETVSLVDAVGRWSVEDVLARRDQPSHDLSAMDGYAIRYAERPGPWTVVGESAAGAGYDRPLRPREAARIFTGAPVPEGADCVLVQEEAARDGDRLSMTGEGPRRIGGNIRPRAMDFGRDALLVTAGTRIDARHVALAGIGGHGTIAVRRRPRIALISTGDELVPLGAPTPGASLPASNAAMLAALLADRPAEVRDHGVVPDDLDRIARAFRDAAAEADIIVTTGGVSVGARDLVRPALERAGATLDFWRVAMKPGKPLLAGTLGDAIVLGLPGNPVSAYVTACLFLLPLIARMGGAVDALPKTRTVTLGAALPANGERQDYLRARIENGRAFAPDGQDSAALVALAAADGLIVRPPHVPPAEIGDSAEMLDLG
ncbi:molybdopterin molybdotransferase MoeA [Sphingomonas sp. CGMCC 1.13654]|uniref:Molybdopterin molybdenumtransferase n=1 Tax=Sphingomonas chungangi TaxID=2683589 RepID=A0A838LC15_9SPHN|nr:gephyrin-like molybdotransferase Glp [Sphingomonas chungangi]MBA2936400.1 molybdopterin molybdotransferase MoeA [Sphingomonas chungangi]MVW55785.1 molybdopterin molybdenumtransferase MoeA [Sphingomonas chungangi]